MKTGTSVVVHMRTSGANRGDPRKVIGTLVALNNTTIELSDAHCVIEGFGSSPLNNAIIPLSSIDFIGSKTK